MKNIKKSGNNTFFFSRPPSGPLYWGPKDIKYYGYQQKDTIWWSVFLLCSLLPPLPHLPHPFPLPSPSPSHGVCCWCSVSLLEGKIHSFSSAFKLVNMLFFYQVIHEYYWVNSKYLYNVLHTIMHRYITSFWPSKLPIEVVTADNIIPVIRCAS